MLMNNIGKNKGGIGTLVDNDPRIVPGQGQPRPGLLPLIARELDRIAKSHLHFACNAVHKARPSRCSNYKRSWAKQ
jgi:hypothetical protein